MNIKLNVSAINRLLSENISLGQVYTKISPIAKSSGVRLAEYTTGAGYHQWSLPGNEWKPFSKLDDDTKAVAANEYLERKTTLLNALKGSELAEMVCSVPSDNEFVYFRQTESGLEIALVAWSFRFPDKPNGCELETWKKKIAAEDVNISFVWNKSKFQNFDFFLDNYARKTGSDGWFRVGGKIPIHKKFKLTLPNERSFGLTVTEGQNEYVYDLTEYFIADIRVEKDNQPISNTNCIVGFGQVQEILTTDDNGEAHIRIPLVPNTQGLIADKQPECAVCCNYQSKVLIPATGEQHLVFEFHFETPTPPEPEPPAPEPPVPEPPAPEPPAPEPDPTVPPAPPSEKETLVSIRILDYEGFPVVELPVVLSTQIKSNIEVVTDKNGICQIPRSVIDPKGKVRVKFIVTPEYQEKYDIHYKKKK